MRGKAVVSRRMGAGASELRPPAGTIGVVSLTNSQLSDRVYSGDRATH
jgi:hypothetical protein